MIATLRFGQPLHGDGRRAVRRACFERCSSLPLSAVCMVANGVREQLARLLAADCELVLSEPAVPQEDAKPVLFESALVYRVRGALCSAFIILRQDDALRLAGAAFRESQRDGSQPLSAIERQTVDRIASSLAPLCAPLCGQPVAAAREDPRRALAESMTYFEVRTAAEPAIAIGFAIDRDPDEAIGERLGTERLLDVPIDVRTICADGTIGVERFLALSEGDTIPLATRVGAPGTLFAQNVPIARIRFGGGDALGADRAEVIGGPG
jgi:flagellar motor switch/type III secretory pathway protein FliN